MFALWTLFVWIGRLRNLIQEPGPLADASRWSLAGSVLFTVLGLALLGALAVDRFRLSGALVRRSWASWAVLPLAALTTAVWVARGIDIAIGDHTAAFIAVHLVLAAVSIGLAIGAVRAATAARPSATGAGADPSLAVERDRSPVGYPPSDG